MDDFIETRYIVDHHSHYDVCILWINTLVDKWNVVHTVKDHYYRYAKANKEDDIYYSQIPIEYNGYS